MVVDAYLMSYTPILRSKCQCIDILWFNFMEVEYKVSKTSLSTFKSLTVSKALRNIRTTKVFHLINDKHAFRISHYLGHWRI